MDKENCVCVCEYFSTIKCNKPLHFWQHYRTWGHEAKWNISDSVRQIPYDFTNMWNKKPQTPRHRKTDWWLRGEGGRVQNGGRGQSLQTSIYRINTTI